MMAGKKTWFDTSMIVSIVALRIVHWLWLICVQIIQSGKLLSHRSLQYVVCAQNRGHILAGGQKCFRYFRRHRSQLGIRLLCMQFLGNLGPNCECVVYCLRYVWMANMVLFCSEFRCRAHFKKLSIKWAFFYTITRQILDALHSINGWKAQLCIWNPWNRGPRIWGCTAGRLRHNDCPVSRAFVALCITFATATARDRGVN